MIHNMNITAQWTSGTTKNKVYEINGTHYIFTDIFGAHKIKTKDNMPIVFGYTYDARKRFFRFSA